MTDTVVYVPVADVEDAGLFFDEVACPAILKKAEAAPHSNGATYQVEFFIPVSSIAELAISPDGADVFFDDHIVGEGAIVTRLSVTSSADAKKGLVVLRFSQSEILKSLGWLGERIQMNQTSGILRFSPSQLTLNLADRA